MGIEGKSPGSRGGLAVNRRAGRASTPASGASCRPAIPASLRRQLLHLATDLAELVENTSDLPHGFDLLTRSYTTPAADAARAALRADPAISTTPGCSSGCAAPMTCGMW